MVNVRASLETVLRTVRARGASEQEILATLEELTTELKGDAWLAEHYGGRDLVPPRLAVPIDSTMVAVGAERGMVQARLVRTPTRGP